MFHGFRDFISRGSAVELAVGVVIGAAFTAVVGALQNGFISPLIGMIFGKPEISWKIGPINQSTIDMGLIVNAFIQFLLTAAAIYFFIVLPLNRLAERRQRGDEAEPTRPSEDILLLQQIRDLLAEQSNPALRADTGQPRQPGTPRPPEAPGAPGALGTPPTGRPPIACLPPRVLGQASDQPGAGVGPAGLSCQPARTVTGPPDNHPRGGRTTRSPARVAASPRAVAGPRSG